MFLTVEIKGRFTRQGMLTAFLDFMKKNHCMVNRYWTFQLEWLFYCTMLKFVVPYVVPISLLKL